MPKRSRNKDRRQSMPMVVKPAVETPMELKQAIVKELIRGEGHSTQKEMIESLENVDLY